MKIIKNILLGAAIISLCSCNMDFEPTTSYTDQTFWYSAKNAEGGLTACYIPLLSSTMFGDASIALEECATPNAYCYSNSLNWSDIAKGSHTADGAVFSGRWHNCYVGIGRCNTLLDNIDKNQELSVDDIGKMKAQARFLRAFYYYLLVVYYNSAPLITSSPNLSQASLPRTEHRKIVSFILSELDSIASILPTSYGKEGTGRPTKGAALALKAKLLLFEASPLCNPDNNLERWREAADAAKAVIDLGIYDLYPKYGELFTLKAEGCKESIFDLECISSPKGNGHSFDLVMRQYNGAAPLKDLVDTYLMKDGKKRAESAYKNSKSYKDMDPRFYATIVYPGATWMGEKVTSNNTNKNFTNKQTGFIYRKYTVYTDKAPSNADKNLGKNCSPINIMLLRYADILLIYAEAKNALGEMNATIWDHTVKTIRKRAGFTVAGALNYPSTPEAVKEALLYERRIEFAGEGTWYNDLRRLRLAETLMNNISVQKFDGTVIEDRSFNVNRDYWWPVPTKQMENNPQLAPNNPNW